MLLQNMTRNDLPRALIQLVQASLHVVHEDDSILKRHDSVRSHLRPEKLPPQQRRQSPRLNRVPHIPPQHRHRPPPINPPLPLLLPGQARNRIILRRVRIPNSRTFGNLRVGILTSSVLLRALCGEFETLTPFPQTMLRQIRHRRMPEPSPPPNPLGLPPAPRLRRNPINHLAHATPPTASMSG